MDWTEEQIQLLYEDKPPSEISRITGHTTTAVRKRRQRLGITEAIRKSNSKKPLEKKQKTHALP